MSKDYEYSENHTTAIKTATEYDRTEKHTVLIVDDTPENLRVLGDLLEEQGYDVLVAINGLEALSCASSVPHPDLILLDIMMPNMDGYEVCRRLKADPSLVSIPVIFISALGLSDEKIHAFHSGGVDYVTKPFQADEVVARVHTHIQLARTEELKREIIRREIAETELCTLNRNLEERVAERTAQLTEANELLDTFCASVSHDLRTPLANVHGLCQLLHDDYSTKFVDEGNKLIEYLLSETKRIMFRIQALLSFSRLSRGELSRESVNLSMIAHSILTRLSENDIQRSVELTIQENIIVEADPNLIYEVMENLLSNAWKYTSKTLSAHIEFGVEHIDDKKILFVRDNGAGFDMANAHNLFLMFHRLHSEQEFKGDGIGLATVQKIIQRHGGKIWAEAQIDHGATFRFTV